VGLAVWSVAALQPPAPKAADAPAGEFSAARAFEHVQQIAAQTHVAGSAADQQVVQQLVTTLTGLGLDTRVQNAVGAYDFGRGSTEMARVHNVVGFLKGSDSTGRLYLMAHHDSVENGPGGNDDAAGVSTLLETVRALTAGPQLRNDVVVVLTDAEEACLCGAEAFVASHPLAGSGGVALNFEARGTTGPPIMFETSRGNADLAGVFAEAAPHPVATSFAVEVYRALPNDTDFSVLLADGGFTGLNTAYIDGAAAYHTPQDRPERMDQASLQAMGDNALALVRSLGGWCSIKAKQPHFTNVAGVRVAGLPAWVLHISHPEPRSLFLLSEKQARAPERWQREKRLTIASIEATRVAPCQCISVSHPERLYITDGDVVTHNTAFALNIAENVSVNEGLPVVVFSMEMGASQLALRMVGSQGRIDQQHLRTGRLENDEWGRLTEAVERLSKSSVFIDETPGLTGPELRARARRQARQCGRLGLIVIDYLQLMTGAGNGENRATEISEISRGLKSLAKELNCPVIALSQLNRSVESRPDKRPMMSDLRESGAIEQDADIIMFIYRDEYYNKESKEPGVAEIIIAKQRNGPVGTTKLAFLRQWTKFENLAPDYQGPGEY